VWCRLCPNEEALKTIADDMRTVAGDLGVGPGALLVGFGAYRITSVPEGCAKLTFRVDMDGQVVSPKLDAISVEWSIARLHGVWLNEPMRVASYAER